MPAVLLETKNLCRHYRRGPQEVRAVDGVDLVIEKGEFLAIVGASGSGKSTLLNLLAGLDRPTSGMVRLEGVPLNSMTRKELSAYRASRVGIIFQMFNLLPHLTALENVEMALYFTPVLRKERRGKAVQTLESLGLSDRLDHRPNDLSGGEQQRVAIARALVKQPDVLFADEPTGNLDRENAVQIAQLLSDLNETGQTVVVVTHDLELVRQHAGRIIRIQYGKFMNESVGDRSP